MFKAKAVSSSFSVDDQAKAKDFYTKTMGLDLKDETMGLRLGLPGGGEIFVYPKDDHQPATFTILNFVVDDIDAAVKELQDAGVKFEHYDDLGGQKQDENGIARGIEQKMGPDIAWFKDPAGNVLAVLQEP